MDNPDKEIIKPPFWINYNFPDNQLGINIITTPRKLRSFLIIFDLKTNSDNYRFAVVLPGLGENDDKIYDYLSDELTKRKSHLNFEMNNYVNSNYDIKDVKNTFHLVDFWDQVIEKIDE